MKLKFMICIVLIPMFLYAISDIDSLRQKLVKSSPEEKAVLYNEFAQYYQSKNNDSLFYYAEQALISAQKYDNKKEISKAALYTAQYYANVKKYETSNAVLKKHIKAIKADKVLYSLALQKIAANYSELNDYGHSKDYLLLLLDEVEKQAEKDSKLKPIVDVLLLLSDATKSNDRLAETYFYITRDIKIDGSMSYKNYLAIKEKYFKRLEEDEEKAEMLQEAQEKILEDASMKQIFEERGDSLGKALQNVRRALSLLRVAQKQEATAKMQDSITRMKNDSLETLQYIAELNNIKEAKVLDSIETAAKIHAQQLKQQQDRKTTYFIIALAAVIFFVITLVLRQRYLTRNALALSEKNKQLDLARKDAEAASIAKSEFLANTSHEIRTPLNAILGFSELLMDRIKEKKNRSFVNAIIVSGKNLLNIINDILDLSKIEAGKMDLLYLPIDPSQILEEISQIFSFAVQAKNLDFNIDTENTEKLLFELDEVRLRQVLINLTGNAIKFTEQGGVTLHYRTENVNSKTQTGDIYISVQDTGIGIPEDQTQAIFEAFKQRSGQSTKKYGGTGLGLAISQRLITMMDGEILLESILEKGSTFTIKLPNIKYQTIKEVAYAKSQIVDIDTVVFEKCTVLIVDDLQENRTLMKEFILHTNINIIEAESGDQAVKLTKEQLPALVFMDLRMPEMSGYQAIELIRQDPKTKDIPVIAQTASVMKQEQDKIYDFGFNSFLEKPAPKSRIFEELMKFIPYTINETNTKKQEVVAEKQEYKLSKKAKENRNAIIAKLNETYKPQLLDSLKAIRIKHIKEICVELRAFTDKYDLKILSDYLDELEDTLNSFNRMKIKSDLEKFEGIVEQIMEMK